MSALIQATLVTDNFAWVKGGSAPAGGLGGVTVEATSTKILSLFGSGIVCMHHGEGGMGIQECGRVMEAAGGAGAVIGSLSRYNNWRRMCAIDCVEFMDGRMRRSRCGR